MDKSEKLSKSIITKKLDEFGRKLRMREKAPNQNQPNEPSNNNNNSNHEEDENKLKNTVACLEADLVAFMQETKIKTNHILGITEEEDKEIIKTK